ncbi:beta-N-acetylhexosaminidase [Gordonia amarae]|uniref:beta-N-acetylhexosaminidase n=2 Tax=Gordonia amarae TaxID=36821 RepID=G7GWK7_9ACTN|nr:glycoside hydrolase family 3 N-terminal domain-containing protein [Gordonia amarae]MCS3877304.1 beta-N-acetylhexosaminidase [Gordonia amarae]GAB07982.1 putative glycosidase [Gordonia amarae NBRC 15530]
MTGKHDRLATMGFLTSRSRTAAPVRVTVLAAALALGVGLTSGCGGDEDVAASDSSQTTTARTSATTSSTPLPTSSATPSLTTLTNRCGAAKLKSMTQRQKLAQLIMVGVTGTADARQVVRSEQIGGIFIGSWTDKSILTSGAAANISRSAKIPLMVSVDQEGGRVSRLSDLGIDAPSARQLAQSKTLAQVRSIAAQMGRQMKRLGVTVDFAPSIDVSNESDNEVIGDRSFSNDPNVVTRFGGAFARGLADAGIIPVYKHFPGHGHGSGDSHLGVVQTPPLASLQNSDLVPFRRLLANPGPAAAMVGHLIVPGLTSPDMPASLDAKAIRMLRTGKGYNGPAFNGVIFSDDLGSMAAISSKYPITQAAVLSIRAGVDVALWTTTDQVPAVLDSLEAAVRDGRLSKSAVDTKVVRVLRAKGVLTC